MKRNNKGFSSKEMLIKSNPSYFKPLLNPISWKIAKLLLKKSMYPAEIARNLKIHEQTIYYYIRRLENSGLIKVDKRSVIRGATAKHYKISFKAFGVELEDNEIYSESFNEKVIDPKLYSFFSPFISDGKFNGYIVVGSPEPHGPLKTSARDGHYAVHMALFLGQICDTPEDFVVKLDVDLKTEKEEKENLIVIGGPGTNIISRDINSSLKIKFNEKNIWAGIENTAGKNYSSDRDAIIARIKNPFDKSKYIIYLAGLRAVGTKSAILGISNFWERVLEDYNGQDNWGVVVRGFDLNSDGKVDSVDLV
ncbi:MAG: ArsR family transcriptional regulator [Thermoproteota archaeon]